MRMGKKMLALLATVLLLAGVLPFGALATGSIPKQITAMVLAEVYDSDDNCTISLLTTDELLPYVSEEELWEYSYKWKILKDLNSEEFSQDQWGASYFCTRSEALKLKGKNICQCDVYNKKNTLLTTIAFQVEAVIYAPVPQGIPLRYLYYTPGIPVTAAIPKPTIGGGMKIDYSWFMHNADFSDEKPGQRTSVPNISLTLGAENDRWILECNVATMGYSNVSGAHSLVLLNLEKKPVRMPDLFGIFEHMYTYYYPAPGESKTLIYPAAGSGDPGKTVEYRWYKQDENGNLKLCQITAVPQLTVTNTPDVRGKMEYYTCKAGYKGEPESSFLEYGAFFGVGHLTGSTPAVPTASSAPKTGDSTPLMALFLLLSVSLAGATILAGKRRGHGQS